MHCDVEIQNNEPYFFNINVCLKQIYLHIEIRIRIDDAPRSHPLSHLSQFSELQFTSAPSIGPVIGYDETPRDWS